MSLRFLGASIVTALLMAHRFVVRQQGRTVMADGRGVHHRRRRGRASDGKRRWPYLLVIALLLLVIGFLLYGKLAPAPRPDGKGQPFRARAPRRNPRRARGRRASFIVAMRAR